MARTRKRYGNSDGGGFPLGQILGLAIGGGEVNPAFGAEGPGGVDPEFAGDPSKAIAKHGTSKPFTDLNIFQKFYGETDYNKELALDQAQKDADIANMPKVEKTKRGIKDEERNELVARLTPAIQDMAANGMLPNLGLPAPLDPATPGGAAAATRRLLENAELEASLKSNYAMPGLGAEVTAEQGAKTSRNRLSALSDDQVRSFRSDNPGMVRDAMGAEFLAPTLRNDMTRKGIEGAELDLQKDRLGYDVNGIWYNRPGQQLPDSFTTTQPGTRETIDPLTGKEIPGTPAMPRRFLQGMEVVPKGGFGRASREASPAPAPVAVKPDVPALKPNLALPGLGGSTVPMLPEAPETPESILKKRAMLKQAEEAMRMFSPPALYPSR
jgi:hypothetical protein